MERARESLRRKLHRGGSFLNASLVGWNENIGPTNKLVNRKIEYFAQFGHGHAYIYMRI